MEKDQFIGEDSKNYKDTIADNQNQFERQVIVKRWKSYSQPSGTSAAQGVRPTSVYAYISTSVQYSVVTGKDVLNSGGTLQTGDVNILSLMPLYPANKQFATEADSLIIDGETWTMVGTVYKVAVAGGNWGFSTVFRRSMVGA